MFHCKKPKLVRGGRTPKMKRDETHYWLPIIILIPPTMEVNMVEKISVVNLIDICKRHMQLSRIDRQTKALLYSAISNQDSNFQESISKDVSNAIQSGLVKYGTTRKNKESKSDCGPNK
jgi:hypothetical protein